MSTVPLLQAHNLRVELHTHRGSAPAVRGMSFALERGDTLGLIGESGCGKSMTALALMGLAPDNATVSGSLKLDGRELVGLPDREWRRLRGARIAMVFQEPMTALNPVHTIGRQIMEPLRLHRQLHTADARQRALAPGGKLTGEKLALDFQADHHEEHGHQGVVYPVLNGEAGGVVFQEYLISLPERRVSHDDSGC